MVFALIFLYSNRTAHPGENKNRWMTHKDRNHTHAPRRHNTLWLSNITGKEIADIQSQQRKHDITGVLFEF